MKKKYDSIKHAPKNKFTSNIHIFPYFFPLKMPGVVVKLLTIIDWKWSRWNGFGARKFSITLDRRSIVFFIKSQRFYIYIPMSKSAMVFKFDKFFIVSYTYVLHVFQTLYLRLMLKHV